MYNPILDSTIAANNVLTSPTSVTIQLPGLYRVGYNASLSISNNPSFVQMFVTLNGSSIPSTLSAANTQPSQVTNFGDSILICLPAGSQLRLSATTSSQGNIFIPANGATLEVVRIGDC
ncbi:BclA C-terminal domain-containing protein [Tissierellaceae bacterium HCP3S3_D8]